MRVAVLDLGSNSFHALVADVTATGLVEPYLRERAMLHLGAVVARHGAIPAAEADEAVAVVSHLTELARRAGSEAIEAVATSALRDAANGRDVLDRFAEVLGQPIRLLGGEEEARLAFRGARATLALPGDRWLVLDLGGGSLELAVGGHDGVGAVTSLPLGVSRLSADVDLDRPLPDATRERLETLVRREVTAQLAMLDAATLDQVVVAGGTVRRLGQVIGSERMSWLPASVNQLAVDLEELRAVRDRLLDMTTGQRVTVPGVNERRADRLHLAALILTTTLETLGVRRVHVSDGGVREGVLLGLADAVPPEDPVSLRDLAVRYVVDEWTPDDQHAHHVVHLAGRLFDETRELHGLDADDRELLLHASRLHDIGQSVALKGHHRHGAYLVENSAFPGFSPEEIAVLASLTRHHRSGAPSSGYEPFDALSTELRDRTLKSLAVLQLADGLDRARDQSVTDLHLRSENGVLHVGLDGDHLVIARDEVRIKGELFRELFGVELVLEGDLTEPAVHEAAAP